MIKKHQGSVKKHKKPKIQLENPIKINSFKLDIKV